MALYQWSTTPATNATAGSINWAEGQAPSTVNDSARQLMADVATYMVDPQFYNFGDTPTYVSATQFTVPGNKTANYTVNRRIKASVTAGTIYGTISASAYTSLTTVTVTWDSGSLDAGLSVVYLGIVTPTGNTLPGFLNALVAQTTAANKVQAYSGVNTPILLTTGTASGNIPLVGTVSATKTLAGLDTTGLLYEEVIAGSAVTSFTSITGLDINTHKSYRIELELNNATASIANIQLFVNGDVTPTNYYTQGTTDSGATSTTGRSNAPYLAQLPASSASRAVVHLGLNNGYPQHASQETRGIGVNVALARHAMSKTATVANITQLDFTADVATSIGIGSKIRIYRGNA